MPEVKLDAKPTLQTFKDEEIAHLLEPGEIGAVLEWTITDPKTGKIVDHQIRKSESFVRQFLDLLFAKMRAANPITTLQARDTGNTLRTVMDLGNNSSTTGYLLDVNAGATVITYGIIVGIDTGGPHAPTINDYVLVTPIAHGAGGGQMQYGGVSFGAPGSDATTSQFTITRNFTANAGGITVLEVGLYCRAQDTGETARYFMIIRDVIAGGILVAAGLTLTINYRMQATV